MKKILTLAVLAATMACTTSVLAEDVVLSHDYSPATLVSSTNVTNDTLLTQGDVAQKTDDIAMIPVPSVKTRNAIYSYAVRWVESNNKLAAIQEKQHNGETLSARESAFLQSRAKHNYAERMEHHLKYRVEGLKRAHNWNGKHEEQRQYNYEYQKAYNDKDGYTNSYGWNVLNSVEEKIDANIAEVAKHDNKDITVDMIYQAVLSPLEEANGLVNNDELRSYINNVVWFASMQSVKEMYFDEGTQEPYSPTAKFQPGID